MDMESPHNFKLVDRIQRKLQVYNIREAFLESAPQLMLKVAYFQLYNFFYFGTFQMKEIIEKFDFANTSRGLATNLISLSTASVKLLFLAGKGDQSDPSPQFKSCLILVPFTTAASLCAGVLWAHTYKIWIEYGLPIFFSTVLASLIFSAALFLFELRGVKSKPSEKSSDNFWLAVASTWISPYITLTDHRGLRWAQLALNLVIALVIPTVFLKIYDFYITDEEGIAILAAVILILPLCLIVMYLRDHHRLYRVSKRVGRIFGLDPVVHRSMVVDFLENPTKFSAGHFYLLFVYPKLPNCFNNGKFIIFTREKKQIVGFQGQHLCFQISSLSCSISL